MNECRRICTTFSKLFLVTQKSFSQKDKKVQILIHSCTKMKNWSRACIKFWPKKMIWGSRETIRKFLEARILFNYIFHKIFIITGQMIISQCEKLTIFLPMQILREIKFCLLRVSKSANLTIFEAVDFDFRKFNHEILQKFIKVDFT